MKNRRIWLLIGILCSGSATYCQESIPPGTILPVALSGTLSSRNTQPNKPISARIMRLCWFPLAMT